MGLKLGIISIKTLLRKVYNKVQKFRKREPIKTEYQQAVEAKCLV